MFRPTPFFLLPPVPSSTVAATAVQLFHGLFLALSQSFVTIREYAPHWCHNYPTIFHLSFDTSFWASYYSPVNSIAGRWVLAGKDMVHRGRGSRDRRAGLVGQGVWLLPKFIWSFSGGEGCESGVHFRAFGL
jgi:hypothetical protein